MDLAQGVRVASGSCGPRRTEEPMVSEERWAEIRRLHEQEHLPISQIARRMDLDCKTVRKHIRATAWTPYARPPAEATVLSPHADWLRQRAGEVRGHRFGAGVRHRGPAASGLRQDESRHPELHDWPGGRPAPSHRSRRHHSSAQHLRRRGESHQAHPRLHQEGGQHPGGHLWDESLGVGV